MTKKEKRTTGELWWDHLKPFEQKRYRAANPASFDDAGNFGDGPLRLPPASGCMRTWKADTLLNWDRVGYTPTTVRVISGPWAVPVHDRGVTWIYEGVHYYVVALGKKMIEVPLQELTLQTARVTNRSKPIARTVAQDHLIDEDRLYILDEPFAHLAWFIHVRLMARHTTPDVRELQQMIEQHRMHSESRGLDLRYVRVADPLYNTI